MRRPEPLPAPAEEPEQIVSDASRPRKGRFAAASERNLSDDAGRDDEPTQQAADAGADSITEALDGVHVEAADAPVRSSDVWRAARARRKALRAEIRRFTQRSRRRRIIVWGSIGAVVALVLGSVIAAYSPLFAVEEITVAGAKTVDAATVQEALADQLGSPLALVDASAVRSALMEFPMIESYALEARPPHELLVRIVERTPIGVIRSDAGYTLVDAAGVVLATTPKQPEGQPRLAISEGTDSGAFRSAGLVIRSLPADLRAKIVEVRASSADDVTLKLADGKSIIWGSEKQSVEKAEVLVKLIAAVPEGRSFDVSSPTAAVVR
ncbi:Cell division protein FtsQ [Microbacterium esteraromaticum]|uniref:Cell division protein FtsQ n=1 Tax=Microbacterium esteraromaticum TaxID=57043 RepID=A0A1R4IHZ2_9MICO|nr:FtsQ-type POTRA domain-containing protein [Microbacterium esteraromaticum]SJN19430.1 Cell division protein FtsQ [Microbacterium esteraromaticum]